jgi:hypothetical protein
MIGSVRANACHTTAGRHAEQAAGAGEQQQAQQGATRSSGGQSRAGCSPEGEGQETTEADEGSFVQRVQGRHLRASEMQGKGK